MLCILSLTQNVFHHFNRTFLLQCIRKNQFNFFYYDLFKEQALIQNIIIKQTVMNWDELLHKLGNEFLFYLYLKE